MRDQLLGLLRRRPSHLVFDLSAVTYCDASGLAVLVGTAHRARLLAGSVRLAAVSPPVEHALQVTDLHRHLDIFATVAAATAGPQDRASSRSQAVASGATRLRRALGGARQPAIRNPRPRPSI